MPRSSKLISEGIEMDEDNGPPSLPPIWPLMKSGTMWLMCALQFGINVGWVFLVTWLPTYLKDVKGVDEKTGGLMSTIVLFAGIVGMLCGGRLTDIAHAPPRSAMGTIAAPGRLLRSRCRRVLELPPARLGVGIHRSSFAGGICH